MYPYLTKINEENGCFPQYLGNCEVEVSIYRPFLGLSEVETRTSQTADWYPDSLPLQSSIMPSHHRYSPVTMSSLSL